MESNRSLSIFILDDNPFCGTITEQYVRTLGYTNVTLFTEAEVCLSQLTKKPDIIFLDCQVRACDCIDTVRKIGRINPHIYLVVLADQENIETVRQSRKYGAFDCIVKGNDDLQKIDDVLKKIQQVMALLELRPPTSSTSSKS
ncbi:response regulator [Spirosoma fluviale]|uniref:Response regulator receiver domain-containing protein n=1 Tax=Spirosoma fluviale TaxID=1597977 RepID=A0A286F7S5_9BACT|nr:response regulator [Spirosoma fluviale]SOD79277.1 Response regulator receiver domain-containing protein [Spirosoma fluviale]